MKYKGLRAILLGLVGWLAIGGGLGDAAPVPSQPKPFTPFDGGGAHARRAGHLRLSTPSRAPQRMSRRVARRKRIRQRLFDMRMEIKPGYSRVVIVLTAAVGGINHDYIPAKKRIPPRVYVDLTPCIPMRKWSKVPYWIGSPHIGRVRIARNTLDTTRIVLELRKTPVYRVTILQSPMRVVIDVAHKGLPPAFQASSALPAAQPGPWRSKYRRTDWRKQLPKSSKLAIRHRGPLPKMPFAFAIKRIAIDPGHGGAEDGAVGRRTGLREKNITLAIAKRVVQQLRRRTKVKITLLRRSDRQISLSQRAALAQQRKADLLVSIHINAHTSRRVSGISTYILDWSSRSFAAQLLSSDPLTARENQGVHPKRFTGGAVGTILASLKRQSNLTASRILAIAVQQSMIRRVNKHYPKVRDLGVRKGLFYLLFAAQMPGIIVEASYLSNPKEERLLRTSRYREQVALGITEGLVRYIEHAKKK